MALTKTSSSLSTRQARDKEAAIFSAKRKKVTGAVGLEIEKRKPSGRWNPQGYGIEATLLSGPGGALMLLTSARF